ncbi:hypothetical protein [Bythopirellula polymerisocia]|nr:hypothetical protein [Bythopirellula polymerisocia]
MMREHAEQHAMKNAPIPQETAQETVDEIGKKLDAADKQLKSLEGSLTASEKQSAKDTLAMIHQEHGEAMKQLTELKAEVSKSMPNAAKVAEHSKAVSKSIMKANEAHESMMKQQGVAPPKTGKDAKVEAKKQVVATARRIQ